MKQGVGPFLPQLPWQLPKGQMQRADFQRKALKTNSTTFLSGQIIQHQRGGEERRASGRLLVGCQLAPRSLLKSPYTRSSPGAFSFQRWLHCQAPGPSAGREMRLPRPRSVRAGCPRLLWREGVSASPLLPPVTGPVSQSGFRGRPDARQQEDGAARGHEDWTRQTRRPRGLEQVPSPPCASGSSTVRWRSRYPAPTRPLRMTSLKSHNNPERLVHSAAPFGG